MAETQVTYCRLCQACCGRLVEIDDGRVVPARGDGQNPASRGFTCPKGRSIGEYHHHPDRLLSSRKRGPEGEWSTIPSGLAIEEVGLLARHDPVDWSGRVFAGVGVGTALTGLVALVAGEAGGAPRSLWKHHPATFCPRRHPVGRRPSSIRACLADLRRRANEAC